MVYRVPASLGGELALEGLRTGEAEALSVQFAEMDPWLRYSAKPSDLAGVFAEVDASVPRLALRYRGELAGLSILQTRWLRGPYVQFLGLLPRFQKRGLGVAFLGWVEREAMACGQRHVWIMVSEFNDGARKFYARLGYEEIAAVPDVVQDGISEILLRKRV